MISGCVDFVKRNGGPKAPNKTVLGQKAYTYVPESGAALCLFGSKLDAFETGNRDFVADGLARFAHDVGNGLLVIADVGLFHEAHFLLELLHRAVGNLVHDLGGLAFFKGLLAVNFAFTLHSA